MLRIPRAILADLFAQARAGAPQEVCGVLAGRERPDGAREVTRVFAVRNASPRPRDEYLLDPEEQLHVILHAEEKLGLDVIGFYHSHPDGPPRLSATDVARASWPGASYLLLWLRPTEGHASARWDEGARRFVAESVVPA